MIKDIYKTINQKESQLTLYLMVKTEHFSPEMKNKTRMSTVSASIQHCTGDSGLGNNARKIKGIHIRK